MGGSAAIFRLESECYEKVVRFSGPVMVLDFKYSLWRRTLVWTRFFTCCEAGWPSQNVLHIAVPQTGLAGDCLQFTFKL